MQRRLLISIGIFVVLAGLLYVFWGALVRFAFAPTQEPVSTEEKTETPEENLDAPLFEVVTTNLEIPWDIAFLPNNDMLVTERPGRLVRIDTEGERHSIELDVVIHAGEGGLLGIALHPDFEETRWVYLYYTTKDTLGNTENKVVRYWYGNDVLSDRTTILSGIPGALFHNGGQIAFGPDGYLYVATGDARDPDAAQDTNSLAGKILRVGENGEVPDDNPFGNEVYSYGHRNPQGLAWDSEGALWSTEHGRSGFTSGLDEVNKIEAGGNYGWPDSQGDTVLPNTIAPTLHSGPDVTWAPASLSYSADTLYFGGLRGQTLYVYDLQAQTLKEHFFGQFGRIRSAVIGPDTMLYITTSNRDGRGDVAEGDDKIIRVNPRLLQ